MKPAAARDIVAVLRARARALAEREVEERHDVAPLATFAAGGHTIGVPLAYVVRAADLQTLTELPDAPAWLLGVTAVEGHLVSLLDVAAFLDLGRRGVADVRGTLVVASGKREIGLGADQLLGIVDVPEAALAPLPGGTGPLKKVARGAGPYEGDLLHLDVDALFDDPRLNGRERR